MSDATKPPEEPDSVEGSSDPIARLIRVAGPRPPVPQERMARVRDNVHARWREAVLRDRRRIVVLVAASLAAAARSEERRVGNECSDARAGDGRKQKRPET